MFACVLSGVLVGWLVWFGFFLAPFLLTGECRAICRAVQSIFHPPFAGAALPEQAAPQLVRGESVIAMLIPTLKVEMQYKMMLLFGLM